MFEKDLIDALLSGKPYFGSALCALQGPPIRHKYFGGIVQVIAKSEQLGPIRVLEIGSWAGASAVTWARAIQGSSGRVTCVDLWQPYFDLTVEQESHYRQMSEAAKENRIFNLFLHNIRAANVSEMIDYLIGDTRKVLPELPSGEFDIVYIDGSHVYESVRADIQEAKRLIRDGGIICGDDLELQRTGVDDDEHKTAIALKKDFVHSRIADAYYHPGVTEAVAVELGEVSSWDGVWATRKQGSQWARVELDVRAVDIPQHIKDAVQAPEASEDGQAELVDATDGFNLVKSRGRFLAVTKQLGPTKLFIERLGERELAPLLFTGESLEEVREKAMAWEASSAQPAPDVLGDTAGYNLLRVGEKFLAVAKSLGPTNVLVERLGQRELSPVLLMGETLAEVRDKAVALEPEVELVDEIGAYNVVKAGDRFIAIAKELGPVNLFQERLGERDLPPFVLVATDSAALRRRICEIDRKLT